MEVLLETHNGLIYYKGGVHQSHRGSKGVPMTEGSGTGVGPRAGGREGALGLSEYTPACTEFFLSCSCQAYRHQVPQDQGAGGGQ